MLKRGDTLVLATRNAGKLREIEAMLAGHNFQLRLVSDFSEIEPIEDGESYLANATIKAKAALAATDLPSLAEDSGFEIDAAPGELGLHTAPWIAAQGGWPEGMATIAHRVEAGASTTCRHCATFVLALPDGTIFSASAQLDGTFVYPPRSLTGFGGDPYFAPKLPASRGPNPYFMPDGGSFTYAQLIDAEGLAAKQAISPRAAALTKLLASLPV